MPCHLSLDYIPTLRNIGVIERKSAEAFEQLKLMSQNNELNLEGSRRRTRSKRSLEREHYFKNLVKYCGVDPKDIGEKFANMKLHTA